MCHLQSFSNFHSNSPSQLKLLHHPSSSSSSVFFSLWCRLEPTEKCGGLKSERDGRILPEGGGDLLEPIRGKRVASFMWAISDLHPASTLRRSACLTGRPSPSLLLRSRLAVKCDSYHHLPPSIFIVPPARLRLSQSRFDALMCCGTRLPSCRLS